MTVKVVVLKTDHENGRQRYKCFLEQGRRYGEFFLTFDWCEETFTFEQKDPYYARELIEAFAETMGLRLDDGWGEDYASYWEGNGSEEDRG